MNHWDRRARVAADAALGAVFASALAVTAVAIGVSWGGAYWLFDGAAGLVVCGIALLRRRDRTWAAVAGLAVAAGAILVAWTAELHQEPGPVMALALAVLVGSAVRTLPARSATVVAAAGFAVVAGTWSATSPGVTAVTTLNAAGWLVALAVGLAGRLVDARRQAAAAAVRREERLELAKELHDVAAHHLTGIVVQAQAAQLAASKRPEKLAGSLADIETAGSDALAAIRRVVGLLRDDGDAAPATSGPEQLSELVRRFEGQGHGPNVHLRVAEDQRGWPAEVTSTVYRVVQESLTNVSRHAPDARSVTVSVAQEGQAVTVEVADDAPPQARYRHRGGYGLIGMRERVETLGGTLRAGPRPGGGWSVLATLPVPTREPR